MKNFIELNRLSKNGNGKTTPILININTITEVTKFFDAPNTIVTTTTTAESYALIPVKEDYDTIKKLIEAAQ